MKPKMAFTDDYHVYTPHHIYTLTEFAVFQHMRELREINVREHRSCVVRSKVVEISCAELARAIGVNSKSTVRKAVAKLCTTGTLVRLDRLGTRKAAGRYTVAARLL